LSRFFMVQSLTPSTKNNDRKRTGGKGKETETDRNICACRYLMNFHENRNKKISREVGKRTHKARGGVRGKSSRQIRKGGIITSNQDSQICECYGVTKNKC